MFILHRSKIWPNSNLKLWKRQPLGFKGEQIDDIFVLTFSKHISTEHYNWTDCNFWDNKKAGVVHYKLGEG